MSRASRMMLLAAAVCALRIGRGRRTVFRRPVAETPEVIVPPFNESALGGQCPAVSNETISGSPDRPGAEELGASLLFYACRFVCKERAKAPLPDMYGWSEEKRARTLLAHKKAGWKYDYPAYASCVSLCPIPPQVQLLGQCFKQCNRTAAESLRSCVTGCMSYEDFCVANCHRSETLAEFSKCREAC